MNPMNYFIVFIGFYSIYENVERKTAMRFGKVQCTKAKRGLSLTKFIHVAFT
ncbi:thioredoxin [Bacillus spizizenii TU-B-10]|uniref:Thioredoxin n=1 Tax=Bacillus spizizenii (strain DSM 15029 / JCM 12233 / NBRC 101239 / NRRL B-23049 / TU-B-10) TaxID=1052585 RepID=G4NZ15_BACS4|nr:thioredoxin [Bacillus spizizenii TU-B-10]